MVKKTVNFDDPMTYHLYYGDHHGSPGTLLTHFPHPFAKLGTHGSPEIIETRLRIEPGSMQEWHDRLTEHGVSARIVGVADEPRLEFADDDDMRFAMVEDSPTGSGGPAVRGIEGVAIRVPDVASTRKFLERALGFVDAGCPGPNARLALEDGEPGQRLELIQAPIDRRMAMGAGTVHHVAWRVPDGEAQAEVAQRLIAAGVSPTPVMDRQYFRSIYFRVPGGVIFEVATDGPGFDVDEPLESLGESLKLPSQYEPRRSEITAHLVPLGGASA